MMSPIMVPMTAHQQSSLSFLSSYGGGKAKTKEDEEAEESEESIAWRVRAKQLLKEGHHIYGSDAATQSIFNSLVSRGEEARRKRVLEIKNNWIRRYSRMSQIEMWAWAAFRGLYLYSLLTLVLWFGLLIFGGSVATASIVALSLQFIMVAMRKRWMNIYSRKTIQQSET